MIQLKVDNWKLIVKTYSLSIYSYLLLTDLYQLITVIK